MPLPPHPRAVVTGAASGLGRALCIALARRGAKIIAADIDAAGLDETAQLATGAGAQSIIAQRCDVASAAQVEQLAELAERHFQGADLLVNNAGVAVAGPTGEVPLGDWQWVVNINLWGVIYGCNSFVPRFKSQRSGYILNVASAAGLLNPPDLAPYNVTKAGVIALSETLAGELRPHGVGVTVTCPTFFETNLLQRTRATAASGAQFIEFARRLMGLSKLSAGDVAARALKSCERGKLYGLPMLDGRWGWRAKRWAPEAFYKHVLPAALKSAGG